MREQGQEFEWIQNGRRSFSGDVLRMSVATLYSCGCGGCNVITEFVGEGVLG